MRVSRILFFFFFLVAKSRIQNSSSPLSLKQSFIDGYKEGGWKSFFRGFKSTILKGFVCSGATFVGVEAILLLLETKNQQ
jgi:Mitochondrial carrier protein